MCNDCLVLHERLQKMSEELFQVKRALKRSQHDLKGERMKLQHHLKLQKEKKHYRNGQKRSNFGRK